MKRYETYKPSGIEWLGDIPEHWEVALLTKNLFSLVDYRGKTPRKLENDEIGMLLVTARNIKGGKIDYSLSEEYVDVLEAKKLLLRGSLNIGDVLFTTEAPLGEVANVDRLDIALAQRIIKFSGIKSKLDNYYLKYWLYSISFQSILKTYATGSTVEGIKGSKLRLLNILLPYLPEQTAIANYLDTKTTAIDLKIELLTAKADKYKALRRSLINETVCRGLNPNVPLKDSGIEWIGRIPEHWEVKRVKEIGKVVLGKMLNNTPQEGYFLKPYLKSKNINWLKVNIDSVEDMYFSSPDMTAFRIKKGDLLLSEGGEVGKTCIWDNEITECYIQNSVHKITFPKTENPRYYLYLSFAIGVKGGYDSIVNFISIKHLTYEKLNRFLWCIPPFDEQLQIVNYLDEKTTQIDTILTNIGEQINKLTQLRKTLINDVVTGKIKVTEDEL